MLSFSACSSPTIEQFRGAILPHHNLVATYIDQAYSELSADKIDRIILISPNHENLGNHFIQTTDKITANVELDLEFINKLVKAKVAGIESIDFESEHGIMVHLERVEEFFSDAKVVPIILKWEVPEKNLDELVKAISAEVTTDKTLIIASIDFSHYVTEAVAWQNDQRTIAWLENWGKGDKDFDLKEIKALEKSFTMDTNKSTAMDSPETLYVFTKLMDDIESAEIWKRTSSGGDFGVTNPMQNTSHLFVKVW